MRLLSVFFVLATIVMIGGCKENSVQPVTNTPLSALPTDSVVGPSAPIDSRVLFSFTEYIGTNARTTSLSFRTERIYSMGGYAIIGTVARNGDQISVNLDSIQAPEGGVALFSPATLSSSLGVLPDGVYSMSILINGKKVMAIMVLSDTSYTTNVQPNNLVATTNPVLMRVPDDVIWGAAESFTPEIYRSFLDSLMALSATPANLDAGYYFYFTVNPDGTDTIPSAFGYPYGQHFLYRFDADTTLSRGLVERYAKRYQDSIYVQLSGGRGQNYYSTVLQHGP